MGAEHFGGRASLIKSLGGVAQFLTLVLLPTLPPYRSDTSISFFLGGGSGGGDNFSPKRGWGKRVFEAEPLRVGGYGKKDKL